MLEDILSILLPQEEQEQDVEQDVEQDQDEEDQGHEQLQMQWQEQAVPSIERLTLANEFTSFADLTDPTDSGAIGVIDFQCPPFPATESTSGPDFFSPTPLSNRSSLPRSSVNQTNTSISEFVHAEL